MKFRSTFVPLVVAGLLPAALVLPGAAVATDAEVGQPLAAKFRVSASAADRVVVVGEDVVKVKGKVRPKVAGEKVVLQQRMGSNKKWKPTATTKTKKNGSFTLKDKPSAIGTREYRVLKPASKKARAGTSKVMEVVVYRWESLSRRTGPRENLIGSQAAISTEWYDVLRVEEPGAPSSAEFTLGRKCVEVTGLYALTDESASGATGTVTLSVDGVTRVQETLEIGTLREVTTDVKDAYRVRLDMTSTETPAAYTAAADFKALCTR